MVIDSPQTSPTRLAAIDVGSNSIRLLVADWDPKSGITVVDEVKDQPRLAQGLAATGPPRRGGDRAGTRRARADARGLQTARGHRLAAVATAAVREAENGEVFVNRVQSRFGIPLTIIDPETEARLSYRSVAHHFRLEHHRTIVADIGGGSLEVIGAVRGVLELTLSLPLGAVRLTEMHLVGQRNTRKAVFALRQRVARQLRKGGGVEGVARSPGGRIGRFLHQPGTDRGRAPRAPGDGGARDSRHDGEVEHLLEWLGSMSREERAAGPRPQSPAGRHHPGRTGRHRGAARAARRARS